MDREIVSFLFVDFTALIFFFVINMNSVSNVLLKLILFTFDS